MLRRFCSRCFLFAVAFKRLKTNSALLYFLLTNYNCQLSSRFICPPKLLLKISSVHVYLNGVILILIPNGLCHYAGVYLCALTNCYNVNFWLAIFCFFYREFNQFS